MLETTEQEHRCAAVGAARDLRRKMDVVLVEHDKRLGNDCDRHHEQVVAINRASDDISLPK